MSIINIRSDYLHGLKNAKPTTILKKHSNPINASLGQKIPVIIPPLNTNINFSKLPPFMLSKHPGLMAVDIKTLPVNFDWCHPYPTDSTEIKRKKQLILPPPNQGLCGSCWAFAGAGAISDTFVVSGGVNWIPNLSPTWCITNYPQGQCNGGNPAQLFIDISKGGIASDHCIDYSWCLKDNPSCNGSATKHFSAKSVSDTIPDEGCYYGDNHFLYYVTNPQHIYVGGIAGSSTNITKDNIVSLVKKHIYTVGPVVGGFIVYANFMSGAHTKINGGVYLERGNYDNNMSEGLKFNNNVTSPENFRGSHAITIVGWGVAKNIYIDNNKKANVPYWVCRNSWGSNWGDRGYFKMAMAPYNKISQFENIVFINDSSGAPKMGGGIIMASPKKSPRPTKHNLPQISPRFRNLPKLQPNSFYQKDPQIIPKPIGPVVKGGGSKSVFDNIGANIGPITAIIAIIIVIVVLLWILRMKKK